MSRDFSLLIDGQLSSSLLHSVFFLVLTSMVIQQPISNSSEERLILDDIFKRTGKRFRHLAGIDRNDVEVMRTILPIAREWIPCTSGKIRGHYTSCS